MHRYVDEVTNYLPSKYPDVFLDGKVDCQWNDFSKWSECDKTCGGGFQFRERSIKLLARRGGKPCSGETREKRKCNVFKCPRK